MDNACGSATSTRDARGTPIWRATSKSASSRTPGSRTGSCRRTERGSVGDHDLVDRRRAADFVADHQQRLAIRALAGFDERQPFRTQISLGRIRAAIRELRRNQKIAVAEIVLKHGLFRPGDVVDQDAALALEPDERVDAAADLPHRDAFGLRTLVVAARVE